MYALDTNTLVYLFKGMGQVGGRLLGIPPSEIAIPSVVLYELELGILLSSDRAKRRAQLDTLAQAVMILPFDEAAAKSAAQIESALRSAGTPIGPRAVLIAATAVAHKATLVTHNTREFRRVRGLSLTDWF